MYKTKKGRYVLRHAELSALMEASQKAAKTQLHDPHYDQNYYPLPYMVSRAYELLHGEPLYSEEALAGAWAVDTHGELIEAPELYEKFKAFMGGVCVDLHAIYDRGGDSNHPECYCAAADLFRPGMTHKIYFTLTDAGQIFVEDLQRWFFG